MRETENATFPATLARGDTAAAEDARVTLRHDGLEIHLAGGQREYWPLEAIVSTGPLLPGEEALLGHRDRPGTRLFVRDTAFTRALLERAPRLSARHHRRRVLAPMLLAAAALVAVGAWLWFSSFSLARTIADMLPDKAFDSMGRAITESLARNGSCTDPDGEAALRTMLLRLAGGREEMRQWKVRVARLGLINAFTAPGGHIILSHELIRFSRSPDEVAAVLAHEMGHAKARHPETGLVRAAGISLISAVMFGETNLGGLAALLTQLKFGRDAEHEADAHAVERMRAAGLRPQALATFLERMRKKAGDGGQPEMFSTHPATEERVRRIHRLAAGGSGTAALDEGQWRALRGICGGRADN